MADDPDTITHVVEEGEHLYELAVRYGTDCDTIWNLPDNQPLKDTGRTPEILAPGDVVYVPNVKKQFFSVSAGAQSTFSATPATVTVSFALLGGDGKPIGGEPYTVTEMPDVTGSSGGDGTITITKIPIALASIQVVLANQNRILTVKIGGLDPITTLGGLVHRLSHLGYLPAVPGKLSNEDIADAVQQFIANEAPDAKTADDIQKALLGIHLH